MCLMPTHSLVAKRVWSGMKARVTSARHSATGTRRGKGSEAQLQY
jgi:hypothetical protein